MRPERSHCSVLGAALTSYTDRALNSAFTIANFGPDHRWEATTAV